MLRRPRALIAVFALAGLLALAPACHRPVPHFSEANARAHVNRLAGDIGSRPAGTEPNRRARQYLVEQLTFLGFSVRVQDVDAMRPDLGLTARVANIIAVLPGPRAEAIGLVAHYDSRSDTPGAADDGLGVAVCLEVARLQAARPDRQHTLMVLLTDAEELGLMGAAAMVEDPEVRSRLQAYVNVEATGSAGPALLFEAGPENGWLVRRWARASARPRGGSNQYELYRRLPNDTDFTLFRRAGIPGLNFAAIGDSYAYHTVLDTPERLRRGVLLRMGETVTATLESLDRSDITVRTAERPVYFDVGGAMAVVASLPTAAALTWIAVALGAAAWLRIVHRLTRGFGMRGVLLPIVWTMLASAAVTAAMTAVVWLLRVLSGVQHPWYAHPVRLWIVLVVAAVLVVRTLAAAAGTLSPGLRPPRHPAAVWVVTLPVWVAGAAAMQLLAPAAAYLWALPLLTLATATLLAPAAAGRRGQLLGLLVGILTWTLWLPDVREVLRFAVPLLGRFPVVTPIVALPALLLLAGLMLAPPLAAMIAASPRRPEGRRWPRVAGIPALAMLAILAFLTALGADAYTPERPLRRTLQYVADHASQRAVWEAGANEPGFEPGPGAPAGWTGDVRPVFPGLAVPQPPHAFRLRAAADLVPPPLSAEGRATPTHDGDTAVEVRAVPAEAGHLVLFILPADLVPRAPSLPGRVRESHWIAAYAAAPAAPVTFRAVLPADARHRLPEVRVGLIAAGVPGGSGGFHPPSWAPAGPAAWSTRSIHVVVPFPLAPDDTLR